MSTSGPGKKSLPAGVGSREEATLSRVAAGSSSPGPEALEGLRVLEFTAGMAGPWIGRLMAYYGAEVIRVESRKRPDVVRLYVPPRNPEAGVQEADSPWFSDWNAGKSFVSLDLTKPGAVEICKRLVSISDVVIENYSSGVIDKLGLGYERLRQSRSDLIMLSTSGYGDSGPCRSYVSWGPNIEALSGLAALSGFPGRECTMTQFAYPDSISALHGLFAVMCALDYRQRSGCGQYINMSQLETTASMVGDLLMERLINGREPLRRGNRAAHISPQGCYACRGEDRWCAISVNDERQWRALCRLIGHSEWIADARLSSVSGRARHCAEIDAAISAWTNGRDEYEAVESLQEAGVAAGVVQNVRDLLEKDQHLAERGFFEEIEHHRKGRVLVNGVDLGLTATPGRSGPGGSCMGHDNRYVLRDLLGMSDEEIAACVSSGAVEGEV